MQAVLLVCVVLVTVAVLVGTAQFVLTMIQVRKTAKEVENLAKRIGTASPLINLMFMGGDMFSLITSKIKNLFGKKKEEVK